MIFKTPDFWYRDKNAKLPIAEYILTPFSWLYRVAFFIHTSCKIKSKKLNIPVICIGNLTAGGAGKTPTAIALMNVIKTHGTAKNPYFLTRGYGGKIKQPIVVNPFVHTYHEVGDEALILVAKAPVVKCADRIKGAMMAYDLGADLIVMDDGLQNTSLHHDLRFMVVDGAMGFGNQKLLPAGPLRAPLCEEKTTHGVIMIGQNKNNLTFNTPMIDAKLETSPLFVTTPHKAYIAFAGLGYPQKFFDTLKRLDLPLAETYSFADHHPYTAEDIQKLHARAEQCKAILITTEKDMVRIPKNLQNGIQTLPVHIKFSDENAVLDLIKKYINT